MEITEQTLQSKHPDASHHDKAAYTTHVLTDQFYASPGQIYLA